MGGLGRKSSAEAPSPDQEGMLREMGERTESSILAPPLN